MRMLGLDVIGAITPKSAAVGSLPHPAFDNSQWYKAGDVVTYWCQYWQATRDVSPPWIPLIQSGEVPGSSDAWRSMSGDEVVNKVLMPLDEALGVGIDALKKTGMYDPIRHTLMEQFRNFKRADFVRTNQLEVLGEENIPDGGCLVAGFQERPG